MTQTTEPPVVAEAPAEIHADTSSSDDATTSVWRWTGSRTVLEAVVVLIVAALGLRIWLVSERWLYADDLLTGGRAAALDLFSLEYLVEDQGGHLVLGPLLASGTLTRIAPLEWWPQATALILLQVLAALAVLRLLRLLMGDRPALLVPLAVFLFSTLSLGSLGWWAAAIPALPLQIGLAWFCGDALLLARTGRRRFAVTGTIAFLVSMAFYERAILIPFFALGLLALVLYSQGETSPGRVAWQRGRRLWQGSLLVLAAWAWAFVSLASTETAGSATVAQAVELERLLVWNLLPAVVGGPWSWTDVPPGTPLANGPSYLFLVAGIALAALVLWTSWRRRGARALWLLALAFVVASAAPVALGRGSTGFALSLPLTFRYYAAEAVLLAVVVAVLMVLPARTPGTAEGGAAQLLRRITAPLAMRLSGNSVLRRGRRLVVPLLTVLFVAGSVVSTIDYARSWAGDPTQEYVTTAKAALAEAGPSPLLDQQVPESIVWSLSAPYNTASHVFGPLTARPEFAAATDQLRMLDDTGALRPATVIAGVAVLPGPIADCGWALRPGGSRVGLESGLFDWEWTVHLDYIADRDGAITVTMGSGEPVRAPVQEGLNSVFLRLTGGGSELRIASETDGLGLCVTDGRVGDIALQ